MLERSWVGRRVSVRRVVDHGPDGRPRFADVVGELTSIDARTAVVESRRGPVAISLEKVSIARLVVPSTADELALSAILGRGLRAAETEQLGGWLLRADPCPATAVNSVIALRQLRMPLEDALTAAREWYARRGRRLCIHLALQARRLLDAELGERGWEPGPMVQVMTTSLLAPPPDQRCLDLLARFEVEVSTQPDDEWLRCYRNGRQLEADPLAGEPASLQLLTRHDQAGFLTVRQGAVAVAVGRGCVDEDWLGVGMLTVRQPAASPPSPSAESAQAALLALHDWGRARGARRAYLRIRADDQSAARLYRPAGYWDHHSYHVRSDPGSSARSDP